MILDTQWFKKTSNDLIDFNAKYQNLYDEFNELFSPEKLKKFTEEECLIKVFLHDGAQFTMCYYLEYDKRFDVFGKIWGGSAFKYPLFKSRKTNEWLCGTSQNQKILTYNEAKIEARKIVDDLIHAVEIIDEVQPDDVNSFIKVGNRLLNECIHLMSDHMWYLKYLHLVRPNIPFNYFNEHWQEWALKKININPLDTKFGRYGQFKEFINKCGITPITFYRIMHHIHEGTLDNVPRVDNYPETLKARFIDFVKKDFHQSSYKYTLLIALFENCDLNGRANIDDVVKSFSKFYTDRISNNLLPDKYVTKQALEYWSNLKEMKTLIFMPERSFDAYNLRGFILKDENSIYWNPILWKSIKVNDWNDVYKDQIKKRQEYFSDNIFKKHNRYSFEAIQEDLKEVEHIIPTTEKQIYVNARLGQGKYREDLLRKFNNKCFVTGIDLKDLLIASHIMPWADADDKQRIDSNNGLLLCANIDKLFDHGLISFNNDGKMLISTALTEKQIEILELKKWSSITYTFNDEQKKYMNYHSKNIFIG